MQEQLLSESQVRQVMEFAQGLYAADKYGVYSPFISNELLRGLNNNGKVPTEKKIQQALANYKENAADLQAYTNFMMEFDMLFKRTLYSYANALSFDMMIHCTNAYTKDEYTSGEYIADKRRFYDFLTKFDYRSEFRKAIMNILTNETYYTWFRKTKWGNKGMKLALQVMPQEYCMLTGYWEKGLLYDVDMAYFLNQGVDIDGYDPVFKKYYNRVFGVGGDNKYVPSATLNDRTGNYAYWTQTSPIDGAWVFKGNLSNFSSVPFLAPFLKEAIHNSEIHDLQYSKDMASAYGILAGSIMLFDNAKSGTTANQFAIDPKTLGEFMGLVKKGLGETVKVGAIPLKDVDYYQFEDKNPNMYGDQLKEAAGVGSSIGRVIYSSDKMSSAEIEAGQTEVYNIMKPMYAQFANFINFYANRLCKKYRFVVEFTGSNYKWERQQRFDNIMTLADRGFVLNESAYSSIVGMSPMQFDAMLAEGKYGGMSDKLSLLLNANTMKDGGSTNGRPAMNADELSDSGERNRDQ